MNSQIPMIDAHVHIERGPYSLEWISKFVSKAVENGIEELYLLEHSHRFCDFYEIYEQIFSDSLYGRYQREWLHKHCQWKLDQYTHFIDEVKQFPFPIPVYWGLEICYFPGKEQIIREVVSQFPWDFLTGSVHWIHGWGFDHPNTQDSWLSRAVDEIYEEYYKLMIALVETGIFTILAHPDSIKCFHYYPKSDLRPLYAELAQVLSRHRVQAEFSSGLKINYGHHELGMNRELLQILLEHEVQLITASDAHRPEDVGKYIKEANQVLAEYHQKMKECGKESGQR